MSWDYDVVIIGAGVCGCVVARELSRFQVDACVIEKEEDVCCGTSRTGSGIVHAGYEARPGTLKARLSVEGNALMEKLSEELDFPFDRNGSLLICHREEEMTKLTEIYDRGVENGVEGLRILSGREVRELEPNMTEGVYGALYAPSAGIVCPFGLTIALAENAAMNGIDFHFNTKVTHIEPWQGGYKVYTPSGSYRTPYVVNAAGVEADALHNMVSSQPIQTTPCRDEYLLLDKSEGKHMGMTVFALPEKQEKGNLATPTAHENLLSEPAAADMEHGGEFAIRELREARGFMDCAGIESLGLTSAPAIGELLAGFLQEKMELLEKEDFIPCRTGVLNPAKLSDEERNQLIQENPAYGNIVCRCQGISEGEIVDAINRPLGARTLDGVKKRAGAGMGQCQGDFCGLRVMEIIARECGMSLEEITRSGADSKKR